MEVMGRGKIMVAKYIADGDKGSPCLMVKIAAEISHDVQSEDTEPCPDCGEGDKVPAKGYWRCPTCDAEWDDTGD